MFLLLVILIANVFYSVESQTTFTKSVFICADDYKVTSYTLDCQSGLYINVVRGIEIFARKNDGLPDCDSNGYVYNYSKPFQDYCNYKEVCILSTAFLNEKKLFDADTYFLTDDSLYLVPIRIEVYYQCLDSTLNPVTSTQISSVSLTSATDRTVMIVLIVLGVIFFLIILAIIALICIRRRNQKKMQREFVYAADKVTHSPPQKVSERSANGRPFTEVTNSTPVKTAYAGGVGGGAATGGVSETSGTYRARTNNAYDNSDNSMRSINNTYSMAGGGGGANNLITSGDYRNYRVDYDEYWKTNI